MRPLTEIWMLTPLLLKTQGILKRSTENTYPFTEHVNCHERSVGRNLDKRSTTGEDSEEIRNMLLKTRGMSILVIKEKSSAKL